MARTYRSTPQPYFVSKAVTAESGGTEVVNYIVTVTSEGTSTHYELNASYNDIKENLEAGKRVSIFLDDETFPINTISFSIIYNGSYALSLQNIPGMGYIAVLSAEFPTEHLQFSINPK